MGDGGVLVVQDVGTMKSLHWRCEMWLDCVERKRSAKLPWSATAPCTFCDHAKTGNTPRELVQQLVSVCLSIKRRLPRTDRCLILSSCCVHGRKRPVWSCGVVNWIGRPLNKQPVVWSDSWSYLVQGIIRSPHYCRPLSRTYGFKFKLGRRDG